MCRVKWLLVGIVMIFIPVYGTVRIVPSGSSGQAIQDSIEVSNSGDTVMVQDGRYFVNINADTGLIMRDSICLMSENGALACTLDAEGANSTAEHVVYCSFGDSSSYAAVIQGFTIMYGVGELPDGRGGGVYCWESSPTVRNNTIEENPSDGIWCGASHPLIDNNRIKSNFNGIYCRNGSSPIIQNNEIKENLFAGIVICGGSPTIQNNEIKGNYAQRGGGISCWNSLSLIQNNVIEDNLALQKGGGIRCSDGSATIKGNLIKNNYAYYSGGGISIGSSESSSIIQNNIIEGNSTAGDGGGIMSDGLSLRAIQNNIIRNNSAGWGGGIYCHDCSTTIQNNTIVDNYVNYRGGGILFHASFGAVRHSMFANNKANGTGGAIHSQYSSKVYIDYCFIVDNGSIDSITSGLAYLWGGGTTWSSDTVKISYSHLYFNTFQLDIEITNNTIITIPLKHNFWWFTDSLEIDKLIYGPKDFSPWEDDFIPGVPGEPISVDSIYNYNNDYSSVVNYLLGDSDTLYLRIYGEDRNTNLMEAAIAILKSSIYPTGIAVALVETDTNSGIYEGKAIAEVSTGNDNIRTDDIYQIIKVGSIDTVKIVANIDTTKEFLVGYGQQGIEEEVIKADRIFFTVSPNPARSKLQIQYAVPERARVRIKLYDISGRLLNTILDVQRRRGSYNLDCDIKGYSSGVYFLKFEAGKYEAVERVLLLK